MNREIPKHPSLRKRSPKFRTQMMKERWQKLSESSMSPSS